MTPVRAAAVVILALVLGFTGGAIWASEPADEVTREEAFAAVTEAEQTVAWSVLIQVSANFHAGLKRGSPPPDQAVAVLGDAYAAVVERRHRNAVDLAVRANDIARQGGCRCPL